ncbi:unnamed protein product [Amoebophrya sp. A25]|nr:unnamed protein product [Amoebophrya sp. A25]|eukprot:GSA25T00023222001.1
MTVVLPRINVRDLLHATPAAQSTSNAFSGPGRQAGGHSRTAYNAQQSSYPSSRGKRGFPAPLQEPYGGFASSTSGAGAQPAGGSNSVNIAQASPSYHSTAKRPSVDTVVTQDLWGMPGSNRTSPSAAMRANLMLSEVAEQSGKHSLSALVGRGGGDQGGLDGDSAGYNHGQGGEPVKNAGFSTTANAGFSTTTAANTAYNANFNMTSVGGFGAGGANKKSTMLHYYTPPPKPPRMQMKGASLQHLKSVVPQQQQGQGLSSSRAQLNQQEGGSSSSTSLKKQKHDDLSLQQQQQDNYSSKSSSKSRGKQSGLASSSSVQGYSQQQQQGQTGYNPHQHQQGYNPHQQQQQHLYNSNLNRSNYNRFNIPAPHEEAKNIAPCWPSEYQRGSGGLFHSSAHAESRAAPNAPRNGPMGHGHHGIRSLEPPPNRKSIHHRSASTGYMPPAAPEIPPHSDAGSMLRLPPLLQQTSPKRQPACGWTQHRELLGTGSRKGLVPSDVEAARPEQERSSLNSRDDRSTRDTSKDTSTARGARGSSSGIPTADCSRRPSFSTLGGGRGDSSGVVTVEHSRRPSCKLSDVNEESSSEARGSKGMPQKAQSLPTLLTVEETRKNNRVANPGTFWFDASSASANNKGSKASHLQKDSVWQTKRTAMPAAALEYQPITEELLARMEAMSPVQQQKGREIKRMLGQMGGPFTVKAEGIKKVEGEWKSVRQCTPIQGERKDMARQLYDKLAKLS